MLMIVCVKLVCAMKFFLEPRKREISKREGFQKLRNFSLQIIACICALFFRVNKTTASSPFKAIRSAKAFNVNSQKIRRNPEIDRNYLLCIEMQ